MSFFKNQSIFPYYHIVNDSKVAHIEYLYPFKNHKQFTDDLEVLTKHFQPLNPKNIISNKASKNTFLLTFDDGLQEIYSVIYPTLKKFNLSAIFFINPDFVDNKKGLHKHFSSIIISYLSNNGFGKSTLDAISQKLSFTYNSIEDFKKKLINIKFSQKEKIDEICSFLNIDTESYLKEHKLYVTKEQIQEMIDDGFYFGGHTMSHPPLEQLSHEEQKREIIDSIDWLKENFNINYSFFSFPYSDKTVSKKLILELFEYDNNLRLFGNSGLKKDIDKRIIQRFSLENPQKQIEKRIVTENLYKYFNILVGKYKVKR
ncbi:MAG: polysaccharide deacetylase family protein [Brumimicrobium sp.]